MIQPVPSSLKNAMTRKRIMREGKGEGGFHLFLALPLMMKILGKKELQEPEKDSMDHMNKPF